LRVMISFLLILLRNYIGRKQERSRYLFTRVALLPADVLSRYKSAGILPGLQTQKTAFIEYFLYKNIFKILIINILIENKFSILLKNINFTALE
jgi:hypothetical protein